MDSAGFNATRWDHWLVIGCFMVMAAIGLWSSWQFTRAAKKRVHQQQVRSRIPSKAQFVSYRHQARHRHRLSQRYRVSQHHRVRQHHQASQ